MSDYSDYYPPAPEREFCVTHNIEPVIKYRVGGWKCPVCALEKRIKQIEYILGMTDDSQL